MKKAIILFFVVLIGLAYFLTPSTFEEREARHFFKEMGVKASCKLVDTRPGLIVMSDAGNQAFVIFADTIFTQRLGGNRVLAFSTTNAWEKDVAMNAILEYYEQMLNLMDKAHESYTVAETPVYKPLLETEWGQNAPFNDECPQAKGVPTKAGCLPVAMAQLVHYHKQYTDKEPSSLIAKIGQALGARYSVKNTVAPTNKVKDTFVKYCHMAASTRLRKGLSNRQLIEIAERNLKDGNPLLLTNRDHAFLADGMKGDFLHLNLGLGGDCNGYYRILCAQGTQWELPFATSIVTDIHPGESLARSIKMEQPGTLRSLLGDDALKVTSLELTGPLNGDDVALIRRMAGAVDNSIDPTGSLTKLYLSRIKYVMGDIYDEENATDAKFMVTHKKERFDFSSLSEKRWNYFCSKGYNKTNDYQVVKKDGKYWIQFILSPNPNPKYLFMDCENLNY